MCVRDKSAPLSGQHRAFKMSGSLSPPTYKRDVIPISRIFRMRDLIPIGSGTLSTAPSQAKSTPSEWQHRTKRDVIPKKIFSSFLVSLHSGLTRRLRRLPLTDRVPALFLKKCVTYLIFYFYNFENSTLIA